LEGRLRKRSGCSFADLHLVLRKLLNQGGHVFGARLTEQQDEHASVELASEGFGVLATPLLPLGFELSLVGFVRQRPPLIRELVERGHRGAGEHDVFVIHVFDEVGVGAGPHVR